MVFFSLPFLNFSFLIFSFPHFWSRFATKDDPAGALAASQGSLLGASRASKACHSPNLGPLFRALGPPFRRPGLPFAALGAQGLRNDPSGLQNAPP